MRKKKTKISSYLDLIIERLDDELETLNKCPIQHDELEKKRRSSYMILTGNPTFDLKNQIQKGAGLKNVLIWRSTVTDGNYSYPISNHFRFTIADTGFRFTLIDRTKKNFITASIHLIQIYL